VVYPYDTTPFVRLSIKEVVKTLIEAIVLVFIVMLVFLQNIRATLIPTLAVPVVLLGTFGVLAVFGYSINTLTMFAMVLAIGLLVDDAIVVVENVERVMREDGLPPKEATLKSMKEITGALIGIATVLSAVFVPMAFFGGSVGVIYRQFSITIVSAMILSVVVALILTPALCATILRPTQGYATQRGPFGWFNRAFDRTTIAGRRAGHRSSRQALSRHFCGHRRGRRLDVPAPAEFVPAAGGPGHSHHERPAAGGGNAGPNRARPEAGHRSLSPQREGGGRGRADGGRLRLRRPGTECRHGLRPAERLRYAQIGRSFRNCGCASRDGVVCEDQGRAGVCAGAAAHSGHGELKRI
jgi:hypothetical protein